MGKRKKGNMPLSMNWQVQDDFELRASLQNEVRRLSSLIGEASSPTKKNKLRARRNKYKALLKKVELGDYGSEQFFLSEQNRGVYVNPNPQETSKGASAYDKIDFQYDVFFRKKRYYGFALPLLLILLLAVYILVPFMGNIIPGKNLNKISENSLHIGSLFTYKLDAQHDYLVKNDGLWPVGTWAPDKFLARGKKYTNSLGNMPVTVSLYKDLGMRSIDVTGLDVFKGFFYTELMAKTRIDVLEDQAFMQGNSWYYVKFMMGQDLTVTKDAEGNYDVNAILRVASTHIIVYGFMFALIAAVLSLLFSLLSLFGYTSRRIHLLHLTMFILSICVFILPAFLMLGPLTLSTIPKQFFLFTNKSFVAKEAYQIMTGILPIANVLVSMIILFLPVLFKNKTAKYQNFVPKGNKPPKKTYDKLTSN